MNIDQAKAIKSMYRGTPRFPQEQKDLIAKVYGTGFTERIKDDDQAFRIADRIVRDAYKTSAPYGPAATSSTAVEDTTNAKLRKAMMNTEIHNLRIWAETIYREQGLDEDQQTLTPEEIDAVLYALGKKTNFTSLDEMLRSR